MISHEHKLIFIHIPKCAGTSIERAFGHLEGHVGRGGEDHRTLRMIEPVSPLAALGGHDNRIELLRRLAHQFRDNPNPRNKVSVTSREYHAYFKFAFVRSPWTRARSVYMNVMRGPVHQRKLGVAPNTPLREFIRAQMGKQMMRSQLDWLVTWRGDVALDFIGYFENLVTDFNKVCYEIGHPEIRLPPQGNRSKDVGPPDWDSTSIDLIASFYKREIDRFGYTRPDKPAE